MFVKLDYHSWNISGGNQRTGGEKMSTATILVVDDMDMICKLLKMVLEKAGYKVITAENGEEGWELARATHPDVVLLDVVMPDVSGLTVCRLLKSDPKTKDIEVVLMTGSNLSEAQAKKVGARMLLRKPFSIKTLLECISSLTAKKCLMPAQ